MLWVSIFYISLSMQYYNNNVPTALDERIVDLLDGQASFLGDHHSVAQREHEEVVGPGAIGLRPRRERPQVRGVPCELIAL
jgi:hypothetical protein